MNHIIIFTIAIFLFFGCSEKSYDLKSYDDYFPLSDNICLQYDNYEADRFGNIIPVYKVTHIMKVVEVKYIHNKKAYIFHNIDENGKFLSKEIYSKENDQIFIYSNYLNYIIKNINKTYDITLPFNIVEMWLKVIDFNKRKWITYKNSINDIRFNRFFIMPQM